MPLTDRGWEDLSLRPLRSERSGLTGLRHAPTQECIIAYLGVPLFSGFRFDVVYQIDCLGIGPRSFATRDK